MVDGGTIQTSGVRFFKMGFMAASSLASAFRHSGVGHGAGVLAISLHGMASGTARIFGKQRQRFFMAQSRDRMERCGANDG